MVRDKGWHSRGYHPHLDAPGIVQHVMFRLYDSVPAELMKRWRRELSLQYGTRASGPPSKASEPEARILSFLLKRIEKHADEGHGKCWLRDVRVTALVANALRHFNGERYRLMEWCVMPNHVHVLVETVPQYSLTDIVRSWKTFTAQEANRLLGRSGEFWMADYFDRFVRDDVHLEAVRRYIRRNPVNAGLCIHDEDWRWSSANNGTRTSGPPSKACEPEARVPHA